VIVLIRVCWLYYRATPCTTRTTLNILQNSYTIRYDTIEEINVDWHWLFHCLAVHRFYRAMHYSAKRGLAIACRLYVRPSVRLSVTLVDYDHIGWNSSKIFSRLVSVGHSLYADPNIMDLLQGEQPEIWAQSDPTPVDLSVGDIRSQIAAEWLQIAQWSQWRAYKKITIALSNGTIADPYNLPFPPKWGSHMPP